MFANIHDIFESDCKQNRDAKQDENEPLPDGRAFSGRSVRGRSESCISSSSPAHV
ncbi:unnamed protein product [Symbiodinium natans]|uniref:Uncharacterized protein n=1 Tax=Symbiodinium natans TaxID=878477 RepID=A0A812V6C3_9DINO|nr:unnamed protein product [Symbiodinium natans]